MEQGCTSSSSPSSVSLWAGRRPAAWVPPATTVLTALWLRWVAVSTEQEKHFSSCPGWISSQILGGWKHSFFLIRLYHKIWILFYFHDDVFSKLPFHTWGYEQRWGWFSSFMIFSSIHMQKVGFMGPLICEHCFLGGDTLGWPGVMTNY